MKRGHGRRERISHFSRLIEVIVLSRVCASAEIKMPSGKVDKPVIEDNRDGTVSLKYEPREEGLHELLVKYNGEHVQGRFYIQICSYFPLIFFQLPLL